MTTTLRQKLIENNKKIKYIKETFLFVLSFLFIGYRVFASSLGDLGSIPGRVIPKTLKWYLMSPCLTISNIRYVSRVKLRNPGKGVAPSPTPRCSSYCKGSLLVALDYGRQQLIVRLIVLVSRVFANGPRDPGSLPGRVIPKT